MEQYKVICDINSQLRVFTNPEFGQVRTLWKDGQPWFVARDAAGILDYRTAHDMTRMLEDDEKDTQIVRTPGGEQAVAIINESGLYSAILKSRKEEAKKFRRWVTSEILPSIRKYGAYMTEETLGKAITNPDFLIQLATQLKLEQQARVKAEKKIDQDRSKVIFAEAVEISESSILIGDLAKILRQNGMNIGQNRLFETLRKDGYLIGRKGESYNMPTQRSMDLELFEIKTRTVTNPDGSTRVTKTTKVTGKGQIYFVNKYKKEGHVC